jgi:hypothetical protein
MNCKVGPACSAHSFSRHLLAAIALLTISAATAWSQESQLQQQCDSGTKASCQSLSDHACDGIDPKTLKCSRVAQCYQDLKMLLNQTGTLIAGSSPHCEEQSNGELGKIHYDGIVVGWLPATSSTIDVLHFGSRLAGLAFPPGKSSPVGTQVWDVREIPYDLENHSYLYVCEAYVENNQTHDRAWVPGKLLNNNCNVVFEGGAAVTNTFQVASPVSDMKGYWTPVPSAPDWSQYLRSDPGPDGSRLTVCSANISTDTSALLGLGHAGVQWHGHHLGYLSPSGECIVEWDGNANKSITDVRVYFVGTQRFPSVPQLAGWIKDNLRNVGSCVIVKDDGSSRCRALSQSLCSEANGQFTAQASCPH